MAHRAKHRHAALLRRAGHNRQIKSDQATSAAQKAWTDALIDATDAEIASIKAERDEKPLHGLYGDQLERVLDAFKKAPK